MGEQRPAEQDVVDSNPGWTNMIMLWFETLSQLRLTDLVPHILFSLPKIEGEVKETTLLFEQSRGRLPDGVVFLSRIMGYGLVTVSS